MSINHLRRHRMRSAFTQTEMAFLLGVESRTNISRYERLGQTPDLKTVLAYQALYGVSVSELFPSLYKGIAENVVERAHQFTKRLTSEDSHEVTTIQIEMLTAVTLRAHDLSPPRNEEIT